MSEDIDLRRLVADRAVAYFNGIRVAPSEIPAVIDQIVGHLRATHPAIIEPSSESVARPKPSPAQIRKSVTRDALISFEDNKPYKTLARHLAARGLSPEEYRSKWGLPEDYPMAAPSHREALARLAKARGLGRRTVLEAAPPERLAVTAPPEPASSVTPPASLPARAALAFAPVAAVAAMAKQGLSGLGIARKSVSTPTAFRPKDSARDPETSSRHKRWLAMLSEADWSRIRAVARQVNHAHVPPVLTDLSAPLRVRTCLVGHERRFPGEHVGTLRGGQVAVLISEPSEH